ncbi:threonine dehydratase catabolic [Calycina marina]|uniref:Threonine dehydratase catabolic n=1 Tax=Calycina marina TaxID=1763456 RepID=A0A9P8CFD6_9HELO|nr:threonine dehydratase catabolic [Calycina marina]
MADPANCPPLTRSSVQAAHKLIRPYIHRTPVLTNTTLNNLASTPQTPESLVGTQWEGHQPAHPKLRLYFKCENLQRIGAFKARGAFHATLRLMAQEGWEANGGREKGVVTHSSGNHAQALALAAKTMGIPAHIIMPSISTPTKIAATQGYGARVIFSGSTSVEREAAAAEIIAETGATLIPPYDHPDIMLGQGTLSLELQEQSVELGASGGLDAIIAPCGGGGMLGGTALSCEGTGIRVFGAEPSFEGANDAQRGFDAGRRVESVTSLTIADGLRTPVGVYPWSVIYERKLVQAMYSVTDEQIKTAMRLVFERMKMVVEPSAVVGLAVALFDEGLRGVMEREGGDAGWDLGVVFSGGNVSMKALSGFFSVEGA